MKIVQWVLLNGVSILGVVQVVIKFIKELLTLVVNVLFPVIPDGSFEKLIIKVRGWVDIADTWVEKLKQALLKIK